MNYTTLTPDSPELQSLSPIHGNLAALQQLFPSVVREGKVDFDALRQLLGDDIAKDDELYGLQWHGKARARRNALTPSLGTLRPCKAESKNWDSTQNLYIEGDNLEVLKLLQKSYAGKVKMIYIDPPYNTGKEFVYPDNYQNGIEHYLQLTGQTDSFKANAETSGRYHTDWLNMMYPRLMLARELLSDDGVIFISIDDNEVDNLKKICSEIYGENNFLAQIIWERAYSPVNLKKHFSESHDYLLVFSKIIDKLMCNGLSKSAEALERYKNPDNDPRGIWKAADATVGPVVAEKLYPITLPSGRIVYPSSGRCWLYTESRFEEMVKDNRVWFGSEGNSMPAIKKFASEVKQTITPMTIWRYSEVGHSQEAAQNLKKLFNNHNYFDYPKPVTLIERCLQLYSNKDTLVVDFFSGSATTAHAVMQLNAEDGGNRRFIMVQIPEFCDEKSEAYKAGYQNICEIGKERIRRAGEKVKEEAGEKAEGLDIGFRVFKLDSSNVKPWNTEAGMLNMQLEQESNLRPERSSEDIFYEVLLKQGIELTEDCHTREVAGHRVYSLGYGQYYCCFDERIGDEAQELAAGIALWHAEEDPDGQSCVVYVRDSAFDCADLMRGTQGDEGDARKKSFCLTLEQSNIMQVKAI